MPYITREDGTHFVIPSYREVLNVKRKNLLKKDILLLSQSYGEYITLQRKNATQYEVAFSPDTGYLLGESIWHYFKQPTDMVFCEAIPNTTEVILVIVKSGSVYLDGSFPVESTPEELVIFLTQQNHFEIYVYGDVPIGQTAEENKFAFDPDSVKSFTVLDAPVFPTLPLLKPFQLQLVDPVLKAHQIGVLPIKPILTVAVLAGLIWFGWSEMTKEKVEAPVATPTENPFKDYLDALNSPPPEEELRALLEKVRLLLTMPGWLPTEISYAKGKLSTPVISVGGKIETLFDWGKANDVSLNLQQTGIDLSLSITMPKSRPIPKQIYPLKEAIAYFTDQLAEVYPGNHIQLGTFDKKSAFTRTSMTITFDKISPDVLELIGLQWQHLPFAMQQVSLKVDSDGLSGSIMIDVLGN